MPNYEHELIELGHDYINNHALGIEQAMLTLSELERYRDDLATPRIEDYLWSIYWRLQQADAAGERLKKYLGEDNV